MKKNFAFECTPSVRIDKIQAINDITLDRGEAQALTNIEFFVNGKYLTNIRGDGYSYYNP